MNRKYVSSLAVVYLPSYLNPQEELSQLRNEEITFVCLLGTSGL